MARAAMEELAARQSTFDERKQRLDNLARPEKGSAALNDKIRQERQALDVLGPETDCAAMEARIAELDTTIAALETEHNKLRETAAERQQQTAIEKARRAEMLSSVPTSLQDPAALTAAKAEASEVLKERQAAKAAAETEAQRTRETALVAVKDREAADKALAECKERHRKAAEEFNARLVEANLSDKEFRGLKPDLATLDEDRERLEDYRRTLMTAKEAAAAAASAVAELDCPDLAEYRDKERAAAEKHAKATEQRIGAGNRADGLAKLRDALAETQRRIDEAEAASGPLRALAAQMNGHNPQKLDLETFAIGALFDEVLRAANLRLQPMTTHRYRLEREREEAGRGRRGLGIQVFDNHTGKARPTATLSGGETFMAALALALGLADVVESASGKVRLDTIFIDEGFGSLDTENGSGTLDQVLQVLNGLARQNRAVGLISHVHLVQDAIPNGFYIKKGPTGSSVEPRGFESL